MRPRTYGNLPSELSGLVGRGRELAALERLLERSRLVTVTGVGGVGKSRLALRAAAEVQERYCDGAWLAELSAVRDPDLLAHALSEALGLTDHTTRPPRAVLAEYVAGRELLLVLDGCEQLVEPCAELVRELLRRAPGLRVLAAARRPLSVDGEQVFPLAPLEPAAAAELLEVRAAAAAPGFRVADADRAAVAELCVRLEGLPLALELAAGRLRSLSATQVLARLEDRFRLLTGGARGALPRHRALRTAIGWSHELCTAAERLLWARLSVFAGRFDLEAAEYVCSGPDLPAEEVLDVLGELLAQSLLVREDGPAGARYRMLDTVREYGAQWLAAQGEAGRVRRRHRDWYMGLATWCELDWFSPRQQEVAALVDAELPNLRLALETCLDDPAEAHLGQYLAGTLWFCWAGCGRLAEGRHWLDRALEAAARETAHDGSRLKALWVLGYVACLQGDAVAALGALHECREGAEQADSPLAAAYAVHRLGCLALVSDDMERAGELLGDALERYRQAGELNSNVLMCQVELAMALAFQGDLPGALELCHEVREICEDRGEQWSRAYALYVLAYAALGAGDCGQARRLLVECVTINHTFHDLLGLVLALELLALVTVSEGDAGEAAVLQGAAEEMWRSVGLQLFGSGYFNGPRLACRQQASELLGAAGYAERVAEGRLLPLDPLVERAVRFRVRRLPQAGGTGGGRAAARRGQVPDSRKPAGSPSGEPTG
ncbi:regulator [Streptomyces bambusae]|uniref:ATP-binding protein n=1 Tax=Streptomyces bambusae TaxID=1550616 RepID=UPI001CFDC3D8|nr:regulator [Streptomyces bambusae]MCB5165322.1 regulator [Streptomyces bambusae]